MQARVTKGGRGLGKVLEILGETLVASEPGKGALDHPTARQGAEALRAVASLDDLQAQQRHLCHRSYNLPGVVTSISPDQFKPRKAQAYLVEATWPRRGPGLQRSGRQLASVAIRVRDWLGIGKARGRDHWGECKKNRGGAQPVLQSIFYARKISKNLGRLAARASLI